MYLLFSMNTIKYEIKIGNGNIEQNTLLINTHIYYYIFTKKPCLNFHVY